MLVLGRSLQFPGVWGSDWLAGITDSYHMGRAKGAPELVMADKFLALAKDGERASLSGGSIPPPFPLQECRWQPDLPVTHLALASGCSAPPDLSSCLSYLV